MKLIPLTGKWGLGKFAIVDDDDFVYLSQWKWVCLDTGYPARNIYAPKNKTRITPLHRVLIRDVPKGLEVDHINRNKLDNRRENLRVVTRAVNMMNRNCYDCLWPRRGVSWHKGNKLWRVQISINGKNTHIGYFKNIKDAEDAFIKEFTKIHKQSTIPTGL